VIFTFFLDDNLGPHLRVRYATQLGAEHINVPVRIGVIQK